MAVWKVDDICICMKCKPCWISSSSGSLRGQSSALAFSGRWRIYDASFKLLSTIFLCWLFAPAVVWYSAKCHEKPLNGKQLPPEVLLIAEPLILVWTCNLPAIYILCEFHHLAFGDGGVLILILFPNSSVLISVHEKTCIFCSDIPKSEEDWWRAWMCSQCFLTPVFHYCRLTCAPGFLHSLGHEITPVIWTHGKRLNWRGPCSNDGGSRGGCC